MSTDPLPADLRLNQIQFMATHNSSHQLMAPDERFRWLMGSDLDSYRYEHLPLDRQLTDQQVRGIELDLYPDPDGGRYTWPLARRWHSRGRPKLVELRSASSSPNLVELRSASSLRPESLWRRPGFKVMHAPDADYRTSCPTMIGALQTVKHWSAAHPGHVPVVIQLELKATWPWARVLRGARVPRWSPAILDALDAEIRSVFDERSLLTPDRIRGTAPTLEQAVLESGWPRVDDVRDTVLFFLDYGDQDYIRDNYRAGRPSLQGRVAFTTPPPGQSDSAFIMHNDPRGQGFLRIRALVNQGYLVRTRSDVPVSTAKADEHRRPDLALASGAQMISTDFPVPGLAFRWGDGTFVSCLPDGSAVRPNPVTAPAGGGG